MLYGYEGLQTVPHQSPPYLNINEAEKIPAESSQGAVRGRALSKTRRLALAILIAVLTLIVALGIGLGVGLTRQKAQGAPAENNGTSSNSTTNPSPLPLPVQGVVNDTSLAAALDSEGGRHVFFQGFNGSLRHSAFNASTNSWPSKADYIRMDTVPRDHTPLAAVTNARESRNNGATGDLHLFYIDTNDSVTAITYPVEGSTSSLSMNNLFPVVPGSRSLSVTPVGPSENSTNAEVVLFFEAPNRNITVMRGYYTASQSTPWT